MTEEEFQAHMRTLLSDLLPEDQKDFHDGMGGWLTRRGPRRRVECADGYSVSVQGGYGKYSSPRCDEADEYRSWELGFPSDRPTAEVMGYCEHPEDPTNAIYPYVPTSAVIRLIEAHGGLAGPTQ